MNEREELYALMQQGATVITPNNRLANHLLAGFSRRQSSAVQEKPRCLPYQMFLQEAYHLHSRSNPHAILPVLLTAQQLNYVWTDLLAQHLPSPINKGLLDEIQDAWRRGLNWQLDWKHAAFSMTPQVRLCQQWVRQFHEKLQQLDAICFEQLVDFFQQQQVRFEPGLYIWYCFDDYTPQQSALQRYMEQQGCIVQHRDLRTGNATAHLYEAKDEDDERLQLVYWLQAQIAAGFTRIAVVVPDLQGQASGLQRLLQRHLPSSLFDISLGQPLSSFPLVAHALAFLALGKQTLNQQQARLLLTSPYLAASQSEMIARAEVLQDGNILQEQTIDYAFFQSSISRYAPLLARLIESMPTWPKQATVHQWADLFVTRLQYLGFPGECTLNSEMYQCYQRLSSLFDEFKQLTMLSASMTQVEALSTLEALAANTVFQAQKTESNVQILGLLEASGCHFDSLWVMGMTDECLPQKIRLSAFIPVLLQRELAMPHASPKRESMLASTIIERFKNSSDRCVFSYSRLSKDKPNLPSPLVRFLPLYEARAKQATQKILHLEQVSESYELPITGDETLTASSALLANQAKCPFRAFAQHRLQAKKGPEQADGPSQIERGKMIHKIMELLWQQLQSQERLLRLSADELDGLIERAINEAIAPYQLLRPQSFPPAVQVVERQRLRRLVHVCLEWEKQRPSFSVDALEKAYSLELGGITFQLRLDRLDKVTGGKKWVIDYKTSLPQAFPWKEDRPREPQLLLYTLLDEHINTLLFTELKEGQIACKGFGEEGVYEAGVDGVKSGESWEEHRRRWQMVLEELALEYRQGHCPPTPVSPAICQQCDFQSLCRFAYDS